MKYRFKAINSGANINLFDRAYASHDAAMQAAFAYVDLFIENDSAKEKLVQSVLTDFNTDLMSFTHDDTLFVIEPDRQDGCGLNNQGGSVAEFLIRKCTLINANNSNGFRNDVHHRCKKPNFLAPTCERESNS